MTKRKDTMQARLRELQADTARATAGMQRARIDRNETMLALHRKDARRALAEQARLLREEGIRLRRQAFRLIIGSVAIAAGSAALGVQGGWERWIFVALAGVAIGFGVVAAVLRRAIRVSGVPRGFEEGQ